MRARPRVLVSSLGRMGQYARGLERLAAASLGRLGARAGLGPEHELSLLLCDNPTIRRLNRRWRRKDQPTDVLSFPLQALQPRQSPPSGPIGDIAISLPTARVAARREDAPLVAHLECLLAHGLLHLLGYDHGSTRAHRRMERAATVLLKSRKGEHPGQMP